MSGRNQGTLKLAVLGLIGIHFLVVVLHSVAHEVLSVKASPAQLAFIIPVIIIAPIAAGLMLRKFVRAGAILLVISMLGSFVFGLYYHFIADTHDHVAHVAYLRPALWATIFQLTAYSLIVFEVLGAVAAELLLLEQSRSFDTYAARTDF